MGTTAKVSIRADISGSPEGSTLEGFNSEFTSTNAVYTIQHVVASSNGDTVYQSRGVVVPSSATAMWVGPVHSTNPSTAGYRMSETSSTVGVRLGYRHPSLINVESTFESTVYFWSTGATSVRLRVIIV